MSDLEILFPHGRIHIGGEDLELREYRFLEGLTVDVIARPLIDDLVDLFSEAGDATKVELAPLAQVFGRHPELIGELLALSTGKPKAWIEGLSDTDGQALLFGWWEVNQGFFVRRLAPVIAARLDPALLTGAQSSPGWPVTATTRKN